ncbi:hypothetical protein DPMN_139775 [Dreissena polymorpha]|uniref:Uncharacterized protein n=1 Tax=Dreissena polymorpha TaxID=45954 RepID=A0A9D4G974_DREPO|nr:hypothetical protein DPMN_139775 [Dreissena polymorpha]
MRLRLLSGPEAAVPVHVPRLVPGFPHMVPMRVLHHALQHGMGQEEVRRVAHHLLPLLLPVHILS